MGCAKFETATDSGSSKRMTVSDGTAPYLSPTTLSHACQQSRSPEFHVADSQPRKHWSTGDT